MKKLLNEAGKAYEANLTLMKEQEALTQDLLHRLELEDLTRDQRAKIARQLGECRRVRRRHKDAAEELHPITFYSEDAQGKRIVRELTALVGELRNRGLYRLDTIIAIALNDLEYQREQKKLDEADRLNEESARLRQQAAELLTPYEGKPILDIPADVLDHASAILEEAQALEEKWNRLMKV